MIARSLAALIALNLAVPLAASPPEGPSRIFEPRDLFSLEAASDPQISPDGTHIAYVRRFAYRQARSTSGFGRS